MPEEAEGFDLKKLLSSPFSSLYWTKTVMFSLGAFVIFFVGFAVYKAYMKKPDSTQTIRAETGSSVTVVQNNERKKSLIPFVEAGIDQPSDDDFSTYIRAGLRFEW